MRFILLIVCALAGCAEVPPLDNSENRATLVFAKSVNTPLEHGYFASIDGHALNNWSATVAIEPGNRTVGYLCSVYTDGPPPVTLTLYFEPRRKYIFQCTGEFQATVEKM